MNRPKPIAINTLADFKTHGMRVFLTCAEGRPCHHTELNLDALIARFGPNQSFYDGRLTKAFRCSRCGRRGQAQVTIIPNYSATNERARLSWVRVTTGAGSENDETALEREHDERSAGDVDEEAIASHESCFALTGVMSAFSIDQPL